MKLEDFKTCILVDDESMDFREGSSQSPNREYIYDVLYKKMYSLGMNKLEKFYCIVDDGIYRKKYTDEKFEKMRENFVFPNIPADQKNVTEMIKQYKDDTTLLLLDYQLHKRNDKAKEGIQLACNILRDIFGDAEIYILLYTRAEFSTKKTKEWLTKTCGDFACELDGHQRFIGLLPWKSGSPSITAEIAVDMIRRKEV